MSVIDKDGMRPCLYCGERVPEGTAHDPHEFVFAEVPTLRPDLRPPSPPMTIEDLRRVVAKLRADNAPREAWDETLRRIEAEYAALFPPHAVKTAEVE